MSLTAGLAAFGVFCLTLAAVGHGPDESAPAKGGASGRAPEKTAAERASALEEQARLWQEADQLRRDGKQEECSDALGKAIALEKELFAGPTHTLLHMTEHFAAAADRCKDAQAARRARLDAVAVQAAFLGDHPGKSVADDPDRLRQALEVRQKALGPNHRWVGHTLVDAALAREEAGDPDEAQVSLAKALDVFKANPTDPGMYPPGDISDAQYHLERIRLRTRPAPGEPVPDASARRLTEARLQCDKAEAAEAKGDVAGARSAYRTALGGYQGFGGAAYLGSEQAQAETANGYHAVLGRFLSFAARSGLPNKEPSGAYFAMSGYKGSVFTRTRVTRLEARHPALRPFFDAHADVIRRLAAAAGRGDDAKAGDDQALLARRDALEAEMGRRRPKLPQFLPSVPALQLPAGAALVDYLVYDYTPLPEDGKPKPAPERRLACFISRPQTTEVYLDLGPLAPVEDAVGKWRRALQNPEAGGRGVKRRPLPGDGDPDVARRTLRERLWEPLLPHLDKAEVVLISPDGPLALIPFAALPGGKPGTYLLEEYALAVAPIPRLIKPLISQTDFLARRDGAGWTTDLLPEVDDSPLLVGDVHFAAAPGKTDKDDPNRPTPPVARKSPFGGEFPPLPGTAQEVEAIGDLFETVFPSKKAVRLTGKNAAKAAVCKEAPSHRWLHLATHGYFDAGRLAGDWDLPELRSAVALAGASSADAGSDGVLTALETASLDLDEVNLAVLSACETGLGDVREGEGVLGLQRAFLAAGAHATVTTLWQVDDEGTRALMVEFYRNLWDRNLDNLEALRQAQLAMLRGRLYRPPSVGSAVEKPRLPPFYWAAFTLSGDWRREAPADSTPRS